MLCLCGLFWGKKERALCSAGNINKNIQENFNSDDREFEVVFSKIDQYQFGRVLNYLISNSSKFIKKKTI